MAWCLWLLVSWGMNLAIDPPHMPDVVPSGDRGHEFAERITPAVRGMIVSMMIGIGFAWPVMRLSQRRPERAGRTAFNDVASLTLVNQVVIWPLRTLVGWSLGRTLVVDLTLTAWACWVALLIWIGWRRDSGSSRAWAMVGCVMLMIGGYLLAWLTAWRAWSSWSPLQTLWVICDPAAEAMLPPATGRALFAAVAAAGVWAIMITRRRTHGE